MSVFANLVYPGDVGYFSNSSVNDYRDPFSNAIFKSLKQKVPILSFLRGTSNCLSRHSQMGNTTPTSKDRHQFFEKYVKNAFNLKTLKKEEPRYLENDLKFLSFCDIGAPVENAALAPDSCSLFEPTITGKGLCHTFNGIPMKDIYKQTPVTKLWNEVFKPNENVQLKYSTGHGQANGLNIVLNMFKTISMESSSKNLILSVSNHREWVNIFAVNFVIEPGHSYIFKVIANQIITTKRFEEMSFADRECYMSHETNNLQWLNQYSKSGCQYEFAIKQAIQNCNCTPWNIPKANLESIKFCEENPTSSLENSGVCFNKVFSQFSTNDCECPSNCNDTSFTVFDSKQPLVNPGNHCAKVSALKRKYPYTALCDLCQKALKFHKFKFDYEFYVQNSINPADFASFCNKFLMENVAIVKVEMMSPTLTRSKRDKRFSFEGQLSDLGKFNISFFCNYV